MTTTQERRPTRKLLLPALLVATLGVLYLSREALVSSLPIEDVSSVHRVASYALAIGLWLAGAFLFNRILRLFLWEGLVARAIGGPVPELLVNLATLLIYILAFTVIVGVVFKAPLTGFWTTSGVIGIVIGLALRNTISDLFTGIAINIDRPFRIGDWVQVHEQRPEQNIVGEVMEMNWRTTRIRTEENNMVVVPNSVIGLMSVTNFHAPGAATREETFFCLDFSVPAERARKVLLAGVRAAMASEGFVADRDPEVLVERTTELGVEYKVRYWLTPWQGTSPSRARDAVTTSVLRHLAHAGLALAYPKEEVYFERLQPRHLDSASEEDRRRLLRNVDLFAPLTEQELAALASSMARRTWSAGDVVVREGESGDTMFVLSEGVLEAFTQSNGNRHTLAEIVPGQIIGEMSVLTGDRRMASVIATTDAVAFEITKDNVQELLSSRPELAVEISKIVADRWTSNEEVLADAATRDREDESASRAVQLLGRIRSFFASVS
jgi:small-conductance mechanosensitive channel/CRP-like cAMP-binding protein